MGRCTRLIHGLLAVALSLSIWSCRNESQSDTPCEAPSYLAEELHDTAVHEDEALSDVRIACNRWPDCYSNETAVHDIFRIEGASTKSDPEKAQALWKWYRILMSATLGGYCYENKEGGAEGIVYDPHKIFTVYGHHQCDGLSWALVPLWRAAGYIAFDECHHGHTIASLRYQDADGNYRFHDFDPQHRYFYWNDEKKIVGTWTLPVTHSRVHRHLLAPQVVHTLRTSLRNGETLVRSWENEGHVIEAERHGKDAVPKSSRYQKTEKNTAGIYQIAGQETQILEATPEKDGAVFRLPSPYVLIEATCEAQLRKGSDDDICQLLLSVDGGRNWRTIYTLEKAGTESVKIQLGREARLTDKPDAYTAYEFQIKTEFKSAHDPSAVGVRNLKIVAQRELNQRTLPSLRPGVNVLRVSAEKMEPGKLLELSVSFSVKGEERGVTQRIASFPHYFQIDTGPADELVVKNFDWVFNSGDIKMHAFKMRLIPANGQVADASLPQKSSAEAFAQAFPHPANLATLEPVKFPETDLSETSGFLPQGTVQVSHDTEKMNQLIEKMNTGTGMDPWVAAEELGAYPEAIDALLAALPKADLDLTSHICKALAQLKNRKAIKPLLEKWEVAPRCSPGTRYIPDVLATLGDRSVVPALTAKLKEVRFDFRFHIAYALGKLGGDEAERTLHDLAERDPFPAIRQFAREQLKQMPR
jgi:hypothetical protein